MSKDYKKKKDDPGFVEKERSRGRDKYRRLYVGTGKARPENNARWEARYPEKRIAAIRAYSNVDTPEGLENHHWSYLEEHWLDVLFLTKKQHKKAHRFMIYDQEQKMYRRTDDNTLLDTKERHENYIKWCIEHKED